MGLKDLFDKKGKLRKEGQACEFKEDYEGAIKKYSDAIEHGDVASMVLLAGLYKDGKGTKQDYNKAFFLYKKASDSGYSYGSELLADCYYKGIGTDVDYANAVKISKELITRESFPNVAMLVLAKCCLYGNGTAKDPEQAVSLLKKILETEEHNYEAIYLYAQCMENGWGTPADKATAWNYYLRAADSKYSIAEIQYNVANMIFDKAGSANDYAKARLLLQYAADQGYEPAKGKFTEVTETLSKELTVGVQLKRLAEQCKARANSRELDALIKCENGGSAGRWIGVATTFMRRSDYKMLAYPLFKLFATGHAMDEKIILPQIPDKDSQDCYEIAEGMYSKAKSAFDCIIPLYESAAASNTHAEAMYRLYQIYDMYNKKGFNELSKKWLEKAAAAGHPIARKDPLAMLLSAINGDEKCIYALFSYYRITKNHIYNDDFTDEKILELLLNWCMYTYEERVNNADHPDFEGYYELSKIYDDAKDYLESEYEKMTARKVFWGKKALEAKYLPMQLEAATNDAMAMSVGERGAFGLSKSTIRDYILNAKLDHLKGTDTVENFLETAELYAQYSAPAAYVSTVDCTDSTPQQTKPKRELASNYSMSGSSSTFFVDRTRYGDEVVLKNNLDESVEIVATKGMNFETDGILYGINGEVFNPCS